VDGQSVLIGRHKDHASDRALPVVDALLNPPVSLDNLDKASAEVVDRLSRGNATAGLVQLRDKVVRL
jgi:hypothetical protein